MPSVARAFHTSVSRKSDTPPDTPTTSDASLSTETLSSSPPSTRVSVLGADEPESPGPLVIRKFVISEEKHDKWLARQEERKARSEAAHYGEPGAESTSDDLPIHRVPYNLDFSLKEQKSQRHEAQREAPQKPKVEHMPKSSSRFRKQANSKEAAQEPKAEHMSKSDPTQSSERRDNESVSLGRFTHLDAEGNARMVDISGKVRSERMAKARALVLFSNPDPAQMLSNGNVPKGDALAVARIGGIMGAKKTADLVVLAHPSLAVERCYISLRKIPPSVLSKPINMPNKADETTATWGEFTRTIEEGTGAPKPAKVKQDGLPAPFGGVQITSTVGCDGKTGVEMEALTSVTIAALNLIDMVKGVDRGVYLANARVIEKRGGKSGHWKWDDGASTLVSVGATASPTLIKSEADGDNSDTPRTTGSAKKSPKSSNLKADGDTFDTPRTNPVIAKSPKPPRDSHSSSPPSTIEETDPSTSTSSYRKYDTRVPLPPLPKTPPPYTLPNPRPEQLRYFVSLAKMNRRLLYSIGPGEGSSLKSLKESRKRQRDFFRNQYNYAREAVLSVLDGRSWYLHRLEATAGEDFSVEDGGQEHPSSLVNASERRKIEGMIDTWVHRLEGSVRREIRLCRQFKENGAVPLDTPSNFAILLGSGSGLRQQSTGDSHENIGSYSALQNGTHRTDEPFLEFKDRLMSSKAMRAGVELLIREAMVLLGRFKLKDSKDLVSVPVGDKLKDSDLQIESDPEHGSGKLAASVGTDNETAEERGATTAKKESISNTASSYSNSTDQDITILKSHFLGFQNTALLSQLFDKGYTDEIPSIFVTSPSDMISQILSANTEDPPIKLQLQPVLPIESTDWREEKISILKQEKGGNTGKEEETDHENRERPLPRERRRSYSSDLPITYTYVLFKTKSRIDLGLGRDDCLMHSNSHLSFPFSR